MAKKKIVYIVSFIEKSFAFEWVILGLLSLEIDLSFIIIGRGADTPMTAFLKKHKIPYSFLAYRSKLRSPIVSLYILKMLRKIRPHIVHVHLFDAGRLSLPVAWMLRIKKRIYTRHYSTFHHDNFPKAVWFDRLINFFSTDIVSISNVVSDVLMLREGVAKEKITKIPHGFALDYFVNSELEKNLFRKKYSIHNGMGPVVGIISRYTKWKGVEYGIDAFAKLRQVYPTAHLVLANANGDHRKEIQAHLKNCLPQDAYTEIVFEENIRGLYTMFDVYVHVPTTPTAEAFGQTYVESLAMHIPSVFTLSGIASEFIVHEQNALVVDYCSAQQIFESCVRILQDRALADRLKENGSRSINEKFRIEEMVERLNTLYQS